MTLIQPIDIVVCAWLAVAVLAAAYMWRRADDVLDMPDAAAVGYSPP